MDNPGRPAPLRLEWILYKTGGHPALGGNNPQYFLLAEAGFFVSANREKVDGRSGGAMDDSTPSTTGMGCSLPPGGTGTQNTWLRMAKQKRALGSDGRDRVGRSDGCGHAPRWASRRWAVGRHAQCAPRPRCGNAITARAPPPPIRGTPESNRATTTDVTRAVSEASGRRADKIAGGHRGARGRGTRCCSCQHPSGPIVWWSGGGYAVQNRGPRLVQGEPPRRGDRTESDVWAWYPIIRFLGRVARPTWDQPAGFPVNPGGGSRGPH